MTVLLSSEEKTDDARACAQSGHCPFKLHRFQAIFMGAFSRNLYLKFLAARTKLVINNAFPVQKTDIYPVRRKCMTFGLKFFYFFFRLFSYPAQKNCKRKKMRKKCELN